MFAVQSKVWIGSTQQRIQVYFGYDVWLYMTLKVSHSVPNRILFLQYLCASLILCSEITILATTFFFLPPIDFALLQRYYSERFLYLGLPLSVHR